jgi:hypothetical protein
LSNILVSGLIIIETTLRQACVCASYKIGEAGAAKNNPKSSILSIVFPRAYAG